MSSPYSAHYEPWVLVKARLLDAKTKKDLYFKTSVWLQAEDRECRDASGRLPIRFGSFDDLIAHSDDAIAGIVSCEKLTADRIGSDLRVQ